MTEEIFDSTKTEKPQDIRRLILEEATATVCTDRNLTHGEPEQSFQAIAEIWTAYLHGCGVISDYKCITAETAGWMMVLFKAARSATGLNPHWDNYVDAAGYVACAAECAFGGKHGEG
jgi:hypothetical protein